MYRFQSFTRLMPYDSSIKMTKRFISKATLNIDISRINRKVNKFKFNMAHSIVTGDNTYLISVLLKHKEKTLSKIARKRGITNWFLEDKKKQILQIVNEHNKLYDKIKDSTLSNQLYISSFEVLLKHFNNI